MAFRQNWGEERVYFYHDDQRLISVPLSWTSLAAVNPFDPRGNPLTGAIKRDSGDITQGRTHSASDRAFLQPLVVLAAVATAGSQSPVVRETSGSREA
ncbi:hypothetical protein SH661x_002605 [Planctomicrobium sp. SH661]|uniref:hypothetical protein n=1 Tax=Planctomicrobium sp. SH661 TaxID=3448124 RepID=UPI003F5C5061